MKIELRYLVFVFFCFCILSGFSQQLNCTSYKNGKFYIEDAEVGRSIIERKGSVQYEYTGEGATKLKFKVKWINECSYTLTLVSVEENGAKKRVKDTPIVTVQIIETTENSCTISVSSEQSPVVLQTEMIRINSN